MRDTKEPAIGNLEGTPAGADGLKGGRSNNDNTLQQMNDAVYVPTGRGSSTPNTEIAPAATTRSRRGGGRRSRRW